jgi:hypothetical protein
VTGKKIEKSDEEWREQLSPEQLKEQRYAKFRRMGRFLEGASPEMIQTS